MNRVALFLGPEGRYWLATLSEPKCDSSRLFIDNDGAPHISWWQNFEKVVERTFRDLDGVGGGNGIQVRRSILLKVMHNGFFAGHNPSFRNHFGCSLGFAVDIDL
jgi:hypothetical protein